MLPNRNVTTLDASKTARGPSLGVSTESSGRTSVAITFFYYLPPNSIIVLAPSRLFLILDTLSGMGQRDGRNDGVSRLPRYLCTYGTAKLGHSKVNVSHKTFFPIRYGRGSLFSSYLHKKLAYISKTQIFGCVFGHLTALPSTKI